VYGDLAAEWTAITHGRRNLLLAGPRSAVDTALAEMTPHLLEPLRRFDPEHERSAPQPTQGTLILLEAAALNHEQQMELLEWLDQFAQREHVQVVSTTSRALFSLVERGEFLAALYYRLNVLRVDLEPAAGQS
jgi:transcriptional regulator of aromatic amino acid metabolism